MAWEPDYATADQLKSYLRITDTNDDDEIGFALSGASRAIDHHTGRQFGKVASPVARYYAPAWNRGSGRHVAIIDDLQTTTGLELAVLSDADGTYTAIDSDVATFGPLNAPADGVPWTWIRFASGTSLNLREDGLRVTATWGWTAVPDAVVQATLLQASRIMARRTSPYGVAGSPDQGSEVRLLSRVDADVAVLLAGLRRPWAAF